MPYGSSFAFFGKNACPLLLCMSIGIYVVTMNKCKNRTPKDVLFLHQNYTLGCTLDAMKKEGAVFQPLLQSFSN